MNSEECMVDDPVCSSINVNSEEIVIESQESRNSQASSSNESSQDSDYYSALPSGSSSGPTETLSVPGSSSSKVQHFTPVLPATEPHLIPQLHNVVATVDVCCKLNLLRIALHARNAEYNPKRFSAVIMRIRNPQTTALIFSTGKIVITGARNEDASSLAARKYSRIIQKLGFDVKTVHFKIHNIVASCDVKFPIQIEKLYTSHIQFCSYEPELFPGLVFRMVRPRVALLIFVSGRIVLTGAKTRAELHDAFKNIYPTLLAFKKQ